MKGSKRQEIETIRSVTFSSPVPGPHLLCFGAVHGREVCGTFALNRIEKAFSLDKLKLLRGTLTIVPISNPKAHAKGLRYWEKNLNRIFKKTSHPKSYEARLANALCPLIDVCDVFLDIHSFSPVGKPFVILDYPTKANTALAKSLGPNRAVVGWPQIYQKLKGGSLAYDTTSYAHKQRKTSVLIECGPHQAASSPQVAYQAVIRALCHLGMITGKVKQNDFSSMRISQVFFRKSAKDAFAKDWQNFSRVKKGELITRPARGKPIVAQKDTFIFFPKPKSKVGDEWFYLVEKL